MGYPPWEAGVKRSGGEGRSGGGTMPVNLGKSRFDSHFLDIKAHAIT